VNNATIVNLATLLGRVLLSLIFIMSGIGKIADTAGTTAYMASAGLPGFLLPLAIITELGGGLLIVIGYQTRVVALALAGFSVVAGAIFHHNFADQNQMVHFMKNLAIAGGFLILFANGAGAVSIDGWRGADRKS
jgi:putative oxidoreductase